MALSLPYGLGEGLGLGLGLGFVGSFPPPLPSSALVTETAVPIISETGVLLVAETP